ncbi:hypothetical protein BJY52DRAFT_1227080 [Lactarius psammicola]|nr:hypothetical protein BJY52DRAFT_1227080 [Lactarius psammicola]
MTSTSPPGILTVQTITDCRTSSDVLDDPSLPSPTPVLDDMLPTEPHSSLIAPASPGRSRPRLSSAPDMGSSTKGECTAKAALHKERDALDPPFGGSGKSDDYPISSTIILQGVLLVLSIQETLLHPLAWPGTALGPQLALPFSHFNREQVGNCGGVHKPSLVTDANFEGHTWWLDILSPTDEETKILSKYLEPLDMMEYFREFHFRWTPLPQNERRHIKQPKDCIDVTSDWTSYVPDDTIDRFGPLIQSHTSTRRQIGVGRAAGRDAASARQCEPDAVWACAPLAVRAARGDKPRANRDSGHVDEGKK